MQLTARESDTLAREARYRAEELLGAYVDCLDEGRLDEWPEFFTEDGVYRIVPRENADRDLPLAVMSCEGKRMMRDRVVAIREASVYSPRYLRHLVSNVRLVGREGENWRFRASYLVLQTLQDDETRVFNTGKYEDTVVLVDGAAKFKEKIVVYDTLVIPGLLVFPI